MTQPPLKYQKRQPDIQPRPIHSDEYGKLPPQAPELEEDVLGALMIERRSIEQVVDILKPEMFYNTSNQMIYEAIITLHRNSSPIDMHTVTDMLRTQGTLEEVGGLYRIVQLTSCASTSAHIIYHSQIIKQKFISREIIRFTSEFQAISYDDTKDVEDVLSEMEKRFTEIRMDNSSKGIKTIYDVTDETRNHLIELRKANTQGKTAHIRTPVPELDEILKGGFKNKKLIVIGARPRVGKTQFVLETAKKVDMGKEVILFNLEMDAVELCIRLLLEEETINDYAVEAGTYTNEELNLIDAKLNEIEKLNISIVDDEYNLGGIISKCRKMKRENSKLSAVFIDYLQLIETGLYFQTRDLEVGYITRKLKQTAKELDVPIILLAQLNRDAKAEPTLENLRESGNIEQDADVVILMDRPILRDTQIDMNDNTSWEQAGQFIVAKHRQGATGKVKFSHDKRYKRIFSFRDVNSIDRGEVMGKSRKSWETDSKEDVPF